MQGVHMRILFGCCLFFFAMVGLSVGDSQSNMSKNPLSPSVVPKFAAIQIELEALSGTAEDIYDLAKVNKWNKIRKKLEELKKSEKALNLTRHEGEDFFSQRLRIKIADLEQAIFAKNRKDTMRF